MAEVYSNEGDTMIQMDYHPETNPPHAHTNNFGKTGRQMRIETYTITDGLGRAAQVKKSACVNGKYTFVVSGNVKYDEMGRAVEQGMSFTGSGNGSYETGSSKKTETEYDERGRAVRVTAPDGTETEINYGMSGSEYVETVTDAEGRTKTKYTDASGNIVKVVEGGTVTTSYEYDSLNQLKRITDAEGNVTLCEYDIGGRRISTDNPDTGKVLYMYDSANNLTGKSTPEQRAAGATTQYRYSYNRLERVIRKTMPDVIYTYGKKSSANTAGRVAKVQNGYATDEYEYDWLGNVVKSTRKIKKISNGAEKTYKTYSRYDWYGRLLSVTYPDGETVTYGYDGGGNVISASGTEAYVKNILYNEHGQRTEIDYGNNVVTKYAYDEENLRLKTIETTKGGRTIQSLTYDYDDTGNVTRRSNDGFQTKDDNRKFAEHNYEYDSLNRLVKAKGSYTRSGLIIDNMLQKYDTKYDYTPGGNISRKKQSAWGVGTEGNSITDVNLSYDNEYKYNPLKPHAVAKVGSTEYTYDLDGRMTGSYDSESKFKRTFTWDEEGRLLKTVDNKHTTDYRYDANGERICKYSDLGETIYASGYYTETDGKKISKHIYIGSTRVASQVMSRTCETSTTMKRENTLYYHTDHLGSSGYVTDKKGEFYEHTEYTSSGESWVNEKVTGNANLPFKYTGKEMDAETGLYYYGARYYDARTSRFISADDRFDDLYSSAGLNIFSYCHNNPINMVDPDGHESKTLGWFRKKDMDTPKSRQARQAKAEKHQYNKPFRNKVEAAKEKNQGKIVESSPKRTSEDGYPEWAYDLRLKGLFDSLYNDRKNQISADILEQLGEAYIKSVYDNPKDYGDGLKYQLPEGIYPKINAYQWLDSKIITRFIGIEAGYIQNFHFKAKGEIHWDPNLPLNTSSLPYFILSISPAENLSHGFCDFYRRQTPLPEPWDKPFKKKKR